MKYLILIIGRANDSLWSCCGCWSLPRQEHIFKEGLQGECVSVLSVYFDNQLTLCISVLSCVCRYLNTSGETQRRETLCLLEQQLESRLLSERQSVKKKPPSSFTMHFDRGSATRPLHHCALMAFTCIYLFLAFLLQQVSDCECQVCLTQT